MWIGLGILAFVLWAVTFLFLKVTSWVVHALLIAGVVALAVYVYQRSRLAGGPKSV